MDSQGPGAKQSNGISRRRFMVAAGLGATAAAVAAVVPVSAATRGTKKASGTQPTAELPDLTGQTGVLWGLKYDPHVEAYQRMADLFQEKTGAVLKVEPIDPDLAPKFLAAMAAGTQPDIMCYYGPAMVPLLVQNALMPLKASVYEANGVDPATDFIGDSMGAYMWNGEIYGVPVESNGVGSMVNVPVDEVEALGLLDKFPPTNGKTFFDSYDSMYELAKALQTTEGDTVTRWGLSSKAFELESLAGIMASLGVKWWDGEAKKFNFDTPEAVQAFELLITKPVELGIETELDQSSTQAALAGKVALSRGDGGPSVVGADAGFNFELAGAPRVKPDEDPVLIGGGGWGFMAPANAKNPELSTAFLQFVASDEGQLAYAKIYDGLLNFAWSKLADDTSRFKDPTPANPIFRASKAFTEMALRTQFFGEQFGYYPEAAAAASAVASEVRQGNLTAQEGALELQKRLEAQYAKFLEDIDAA